MLGKSSLLNAMLGERKVAVSATPGKTKYFQTHYMSDTKRIKLVDCPGLIFPVIGLDLPFQVLCGLYPIAQLKEPYSTIQWLCERYR
eukprot:UN28667